MRMIYTLGLAVVLTGLVGGVAAQEADDDDQGNCLYEGRAYPTGVVVCQAGQALLCSDGEWQTTGRFCDGVPDGEVMD